MIPGPPGPPGPPGRAEASSTLLRFVSVQLMQQQVFVQDGSLAFITDSSKLYLKVPRGWREVQLGVLLESYPSAGHTLNDAQLLFLRPQMNHKHTGQTAQPLILKPQMTSAHTIHTGQALRVAALNVPLAGDLRSASQLCRTQAQALGISNGFQPFLTHRTLELRDLVPAEYSSLPITNLRGDVLFKSWKSIFSNHLLPPGVPLYSFDGRDVMSDPFWPQKAVWHGSSVGGAGLSAVSCDWWRSADLALSGQASFLYSGLLSQHTRSCSNRFIVLCVETRPETHTL